jgi:signal transduction histidine kinase
VPYSGPTVQIATTQDITDRRSAEEASILQERNRMVQKIHNTLAQALQESLCKKEQLYN